MKSRAMLAMPANKALKAAEDWAVPRADPVVRVPTAWPWLLPLAPDTAPQHDAVCHLVPAAACLKVQRCLAQGGRGEERRLVYAKGPTLAGGGGLTSQQPYAHVHAQH
jgi:hypothetical protein